MLDEVVQSGDRSEHVDKLKSHFPGLFQSTNDSAVSEPLSGLLVQSVLDLAAENALLKKGLKTSMVIVTQLMPLAPLSERSRWTILLRPKPLLARKQDIF